MSGLKTVAGEGATAAAMLAPVGRIATGARAGLEAAGIGARIAAPMATIGTGAGLGYAFDKAGELEQGKTPTLKPGINTLIGAAIPAAAEGVGAVRNLVFPKTVEENASRALGITGKTNLGRAAGETGKPAGKALSIINEYAPGISVKDAAGVEKPFVPSETNYQ